MKVTTNINELRINLEKKTSANIIDRQRLLARIGRIIERNVKMLISIRAIKSPTGRYLSSIHTEIEGRSVSVSDGVAYGIFLELGTGIYGPKGVPITPKTKQALSFEVRTYTPKAGGGANVARNRVVVKSVKGIKPMHIWEDALDMSVPEIAELVADFYQEHAASAL